MYFVDLQIHIIVKAWFQVHYQIYPYKLLIKLIKIEHEAGGQVLLTRLEVSTDKSDNTR